MMADKMNCTNDEDMIRMAFRVLDKDGSGTISSKTFKHLMTHIGNRRPQFMQCHYKIRTKKKLADLFVNPQIRPWLNLIFFVAFEK